MYLPLMSIESWPVVKQLANAFGFVMHEIYTFLCLFDVFNVAIDILLLTLIIKLCLLPLDITRQKQIVLSQYILSENREMKKKTRQYDDSVVAARNIIENHFVNDKYGVKKNKGCLIAFIQFPIFIALYAVINKLSIFIPELNNLSTTALTNFYTLFSIDLREKPSFAIPISFIIPIIILLARIFQTWLMTKFNKSSVNSPTNYIAPFITMLICVRLPMFVGLYWIMDTVFSLIITVSSEIYFEKKGPEYFVIQSLNRRNKKRQKLGLNKLNQNILEIVNVNEKNNEKEIVK